MFLSSNNQKEELVSSFFSCEFFSDSPCFHDSEPLFEDDVHLSLSIEERHIEIDTALSLVSIVLIVPIGDDEITIFYDPELLRELIYEVSIMRDEEYRPLIFPECAFERFSRIIVEVIRRLIEDEEMIRILTQQCEEESGTLTS